MSKAVNTANPKYSKLTIGVCLLCLRTSVTVLYQDIGDSSGARSSDTSAGIAG